MSSSTASSEGSAADVADRLTAVARRIRRDAYDRLEPLGITPAQVRALRTIARHDEPVRMGDLADALGIVGRSATSLVDALERDGLVHRIRNVIDRRSVLVAASPAGIELLEEARRHRDAAATELLGALSPDELATLHGILERLDVQAADVQEAAPPGR